MPQVVLTVGHAMPTAAQEGLVSSCLETISSQPKHLTSSSNNMHKTYCHKLLISQRNLYVNYFVALISTELLLQKVRDWSELIDRNILRSLPQSEIQRQTQVFRPCR